MRRMISRILGMRLQYKMLLVYFIGGAIPISLISFYLINGNNQVLIEHAKAAKVNELMTAKQRVLEMANTMNSYSRYFYFDEDLEKISKKNYSNYQEQIDDFRLYSKHQDYGYIYNQLIHWTRFYMENDTMGGNSRFSGT